MYVKDNTSFVTLVGKSYHRIRNWTYGARSVSVFQSLERFQIVNFEIDLEYSEEFLLGIFILVKYHDPSVMRSFFLIQDSWIRFNKKVEEIDPRGRTSFSFWFKISFGLYTRGIIAADFRCSNVEETVKTRSSRSRGLSKGSWIPFINLFPCLWDVIY